MGTHKEMKFLILGVTGMAGHTIALYLKEKGYNVIGFSRTKTNICESIVGDANNTQLLESVILKGKFDIVVNCLGILNDYAEEYKEKAVFINSFIPHFLVSITNKSNTKVIHLSTDCVFSGKTGGYKEFDFKDGESFYDRTKALGEIVDEKNLTLRTSIIGPDINSNGIGLLNWFMKSQKTIYGFTEAMWTGQTTLQLAKTIDYAANNSMTGLYNMVPPNKISKFDLLTLMNKYLRNEKVEIIPSNGKTLDKSLIRTNYNVDYAIPDYEIMMVELLDWMNRHKNLYDHYDLAKS